MLDEVLQYHAVPEPGEFVTGVMRAVEHQQRQRRRILLCCGVIGALFGAVGAWQLVEPLGSMSAQWLAVLDGEWLKDSAALTNGLVLAVLAGALAWPLLDEFGPAN